MQTAVSITNHFYFYTFPYLASQGIDGTTFKNIVIFLNWHPVSGCRFFQYENIPPIFPVLEWFFLWFILPFIVILGYKVKNFYNYTLYSGFIILLSYLFLSLSAASTFGCTLSFFFHYHFLACLVSFMLGSFFQLVRFLM